METNKYWFRPKKYGWGFTPISWEGFVMTLVFVFLLFSIVYIDNLSSPDMTLRDALRFFVDLIVVASLFTLIAQKKTKEPLLWRWGK